mmetsp:Transcript_898/g.1013  ORF Transcript_898/g.1013 Transcript_898/m.1013 type:complete len:89 (+) Transcript_898:279-545(+)
MKDLTNTNDSTLYSLLVGCSLEASMIKDIDNLHKLESISSLLWRIHNTDKEHKGDALSSTGTISIMSLAPKRAWDRVEERVKMNFENS